MADMDLISPMSSATELKLHAVKVNLGSKRCCKPSDVSPQEARDAHLSRRNLPKITRFPGIVVHIFGNRSKTIDVVLSRLAGISRRHSALKFRNAFGDEHPYAFTSPEFVASVKRFRQCVVRYWNVSIAEEYACKRPRKDKYHREAWKEETAIMKKISHVDKHSSSPARNSTLTSHRDHIVRPYYAQKT